MVFLYSVLHLFLGVSYVLLNLFLASLILCFGDNALLTSVFLPVSFGRKFSKLKRYVLDFCSQFKVLASELPFYFSNL